MPLDSKTVACGGCGTNLEESTDLTSEQRRPCPDCGSKNRTVKIHISETVHAHEMLSLKGRLLTGGKPFMEQKAGDDLHRKSGKWMKLERVIDRAKNWYKEIVTVPTTGKVIQRTEEPLSDHQGHGSAKNGVLFN